ncbi:serine O-acetyltransferase [Methylobacterium sp. JK268]
MQAILALHGLSRRLHLSGLRPLSRLVDGVVRVCFAASVPGRAAIGRNVILHHSGIGVVINGAAIIEDDCEIGVHVVLGGRSPLPGAPRLERGVIVHAGAKVIGPITVGAGSVIAANAVVIRDMPPGSLIAGVPATVKRPIGDLDEYRHNAAAVEAP